MRTNKVYYLLTAFLALFIFLTASCATTVNVKMTRPAQLDLNGAKTIAVLPFKPCSYYKEYETAVGRRVVINTFYQIFDINDPDEQLSIDSLHSQIERGLLNSPYITLVNSESVERAVRKGQLNPADVYLTGEVSYFNVSDVRYDDRVLISPARGDHPAVYEYVKVWRRNVDFYFRYQIVDSYTEKVISFSEVRCNATSSDYDTRRSLPNAYSLLESDLRAAARKILKELQPYTVTKTIKLLETKTKDKTLKERMKAADSLAENSMIKESYDAFLEIYEDSGLVEAGYNAAILLEAMGNLSDAESLMLEVYNATPDERVSKGIADIRYEINQAKRLKKQISDSAEKESEYLDDIDESEDLDLDF